MNSLKSMGKAWVLINAVFLLLVAATSPAMADTSFDIGDLAASLPPGWAESVSALLAVLYCIAQIRAVLPPSLTSRVPAIILKALDFVSANYRHTRNGPAASKEAKRDHGPTDKEYQVARETAKTNGEIRGSSIESAGNHPGDDSSGNKSS